MKIINIKLLPKIYYAEKNGKIYRKGNGSFKTVRQSYSNKRTSKPSCVLKLTSGARKRFPVGYLVLVAFSRAYNPKWKVGYLQGDSNNFNNVYWRIDLYDELMEDEFWMWTEKLNEIQKDKWNLFNTKLKINYEKNYHKFGVKKERKKFFINVFKIK